MGRKLQSDGTLIGVFFLLIGFTRPKVLAQKILYVRLTFSLYSLSYSLFVFIECNYYTSEYSPDDCKQIAVHETLYRLIFLTTVVNVHDNYYLKYTPLNFKEREVRLRNRMKCYSQLKSMSYLAYSQFVL